MVGSRRAGFKRGLRLNADLPPGAKRNLVLVEVDFPNAKPQTEAVKKQNEQLQKKVQGAGLSDIRVVEQTRKGNRTPKWLEPVMHFEAADLWNL